MKNLAVSEVLSDSHCNSNVNNCGNESYAANIFFYDNSLKVTQPL